MSQSQKNSKLALVSVALVLSMVSLASWQFYKYATFKHDSGLLSVDGGGSHLVWAVVLTLSACGLGFMMATKLLRYDANQELHITAPPRSRNTRS
jgi:hypothetical protein